jgi:gliding motility-associated-like protein
MQNPTIVNTILSDSGTYTVTVTDNGCAQSASTSILFLPAPLANITAAPAQTCQGGSTVLTAGGGVSYSWSTGSNNASITLSPAITGDYAVTTTGSNSCTASQQYNLVVHPLPVIVIAPGDTQICDGKMITLVAGGANSYHWNTNVNTVSFTSTLFSNTSFSVTGTDTFGCSASDTVDITIIPSPPVNISQLNTPICNGSPVSLLATGANAYSWNTGATDSMITVYPVTSTAFSVSVTGANGCTGDTSFIVIPKKPYVITENVFNPPCPPVNIGNITLSVSGNNGDYKYLWNTGGTSAYMDSLAPGSYSVQIADSLGCDTTLTFNLAYAYVFGVTIYPQDTTVPIGVYVTLQTGITANNNPVYFWFPSNGLSCTTCAAPVAHAMSGPVVYTVSVVDEYGCTASDSMRISTINISPLFVPNVFTPNGDGNNDYFQIYGPGANNNYMPFFSIKIFDRIGELVYESSDPTFRWDGTYKGKLLLPGVYVYEITYFLDGTVAGQFCKGSITLLR